MKRMIFALSASLVITFAGAQTLDDGLRMSQQYPSGTARYTGMAGAMNAIGGDVSAIGSNPAALGVFRRGQLMFTPEFSIYKVDSKYRGTSTSDFDTKLTLSNFGFVSSRTREKKTGLVSFNWALTYNRLANFNSFQYYEGVNADNSMIDFFTDEANFDGDLFYLYPYTSGLAYDAGIVGYDSIAGIFFPNANSGNFNQKRTVETNGYLNEWNIGIGGNVSNIVYFGFSIGLQNYYYSETYTHSEDYRDNANSNAWFDYNYDYFVKGGGVNFKTGVIVRPVEFLRIGAAIQTPTYYTEVKEDFNATMESAYAGVVVPQYYDSWDDRFYDTGRGFTTYKLQNPFRVNTGLGFQIGDVALIDVDYEYVNYGMLKYRGAENTDISNGLNTDISDYLGGASNVRAGAEVRFGPFATRLGASYMQSPYKTGINKDAHAMMGTAGFGYKGKYFFADMAYAYMHNQSYLSLYDYAPGEQPIVENNSVRSRLLMTFGFVF